MTSTLDVGDLELAYTESGTGTPVVWLHGSGPGATGMSNFGANLPAFEDFRNIVVDLPGWGRSPRPAMDEPLIESTAVAEAPSAESIELEPAPIETPLAEAPIVPSEPPMIEPATPVGMLQIPVAADEESEPQIVVPVSKPRTRRAPRRKKPVVEPEVVEIPELGENPSEEQLRAYAQAHISVRMAMRVFRAKIVDVKRIR